jgi:hypothetical protein
MERRPSCDAGEVGVDRNPRHPCEPVAGENQGPRVPILARDARVDHDVLQLAGTSPTGGPHTEAGLPESQSHGKVCA